MKASIPAIRQTPASLVLMMIISSLFMATLSISVPAMAETEGDLQYHFISNGTAAEITGYTGSGGAVIIPDTLGGVPVISIGGYAFYDQSSITSIAIPDDVIYLGDYAFYGCSSLISVNFPSGINVIRDSTFNGCSQLLSVQLPEGLAVIGRYAFNGCRSLSSLTIPANVTVIGYGCFDGCSSLATIDLPEGLLSLGGYSFSGCSTIKEVVIPEHVTIIPTGAFSGCAQLENVSFGKNVEVIGYQAFQGTDLPSIDLPVSVTSIEQFAFRGCNALSDLRLGNGVRQIGDYAFSECSSLISVTIPSGVTGLGIGVFWYCQSLTSIEVEPGNDHYSSVEGALYDKEQTALVQFPGGKGGSYEVPESVLVVGADSIGGSQLLTNLRIGGQVSQMVYTELVNCPSLISIEVDPFNPKFSSQGGVLFDKEMKELIRCPAGLDGDYSVPANVVRICDQAFLDCAVTSIDLPSTVTSIGEMAFYQCSSLQHINIPEGIEVIEMYTFGGCNELTNLTIPSSVKEIGWYAFMDCFGLNYIIIPDGVVSISDGAFWQCDSLRFIVFGAGLTELGGDVLTNCQSLTDIYFLGDAPQCDEEWVRAGNEDLTVHYLPGAAGFSDPWMGVPTALVNEAPAAPQGLEVEPLDQSVRLTWSAPDGSEGGELVYYIVYRDGNAISGPVLDTSLTIEGLDNWDKSTYKVTAWNIAGESQASNEVEASPNPISEHLPLLGRIGSVILIILGVLVALIIILVLVITFGRQGI